MRPLAEAEYRQKQHTTLTMWSGMQLYPHLPIAGTHTKALEKKSPPTCRGVFGRMRWPCHFHFMWFCMQLYPPSFEYGMHDDVGSRFALTALPCPRVITSTGCANTVPTIRTAGIVVQRQPRRGNCSSPLSGALGSVDACFKSPSL